MRIKKTSQYIEGGAGLPSYFTTETDTGMKWIDGKTIYRKVVTDTTNSTANEKNVTIASGVAECIKFDGLIEFTTAIKFCLNYYINSSSYAITYNDINNGNLRMRTTTTNLSKPITYIVEYTKN